MQHDRAHRNGQIARIPWVTSLARPRPRCEGTTVRKTLCKNNARWHFDALSWGRSSTGNYCLFHLTDQWHFSPDEKARLDEWRSTQ